VSDLVLDLGKQDSLAATVKRYSGVPHEAVELGSFLHPNLERIFALAPDWVVTDDSLPPPSGRARWEAKGTRTLVLSLKTVRDLGTAADRLLGEVYADSRRVSPALEKCLRGLGGPAVPILIFVSMSPPILAGHASFLNSLAETAGYVNLAGKNWAAAYPSVTEEWLLSHRPEIVFHLDQGFEAPEIVGRRVSYWWPRPPKVLSLPQDPFARAGFETLRHWEKWQRVTPKECHEVR